VRRTVLVSLLVLAAAGCGGSDGSDGGNSSARTVDPGIATGLNGETVRVRGFFSHKPNAEARMCSALDESYPPACSSPFLPVSNLSKEREQALQLTRDPETGARWSPGEVELRGRIDDGTLVVE
jgi:hypothetical protein